MLLWKQEWSNFFNIRVLENCKAAGISSLSNSKNKERKKSEDFWLEPDPNVNDFVTFKGA